MNWRILNEKPNVGIRKENPNVHTSSFQTGSNLKILAGTPIGLLLSLTYAETTSLPSFGDERPSISIRTA